MGRKNTVSKGEIARYEQFLLFPQCFQKACLPEASKGVVVREWVNGGAEIAGYEQFLLLSQCFLLFCKTSRHFHQI